MQKNDNITRRLIISFSFLILVYMVFGLYSLYDIRTISGLTRTIYNHPLVVSNAALQSNVSITKMHRDMKDIVLFQSASRIQNSIATVGQQEQLVYQHLDIVQDRILGAEGKNLEKETRTLFENWRPIRKEVITLVRNGQSEKAAEITIGKGADHVAKLEEKLVALTNYAKSKATSFMNESESTHSRLNVSLIIFLVLAVSVSFLIAIFTLKRTASAENELRESKQLLVNAIDYAPIGMVLVKPQGKFYKINQAFCKMTGYSEKELSDMVFQEITHPDDYDVGSNVVKQLIEGKLDQTAFEKRYVKKDGDVIDVYLTTSLLWDAKGLPSYFFTQVQDITDRKQVERDLWIAQSIVENSSLPLFRIDENTRFQYANTAACRSLGYSQKELLGMSIPDIDPNWTADFWKNEGLPFLQQHNEGHFESVYRRKDGSEFPVEINSYRINFDGDFYFVSTVIDISDRKHAEEKLKRSGNFTKALLNAVPTPVFYKDKDGFYQGCNRAFSEFMGVTPDEIKGKRVDELWPSDHATIYHQKDLELMKHPEHQVYEFEAKDKSGETRPVIFAKDVFYDEDGKIAGIIGAFLDITNLKKKEEELRHLRNYLSNIIDSMPSVLVGVDIDGKVTQWNHQAEQVTGLSVSEAKYQPLARVFSRLVDQMDRIQTSIRDRRVLTDLKVSHKHQDETCYEDVTIFPLVANGVEGAVIRVDDVTDRVRLEEMMIQSEKMLSVGGLAAGMAHEINNPLAGILQNASVLENRLIGDLPANREAAETAGITMAGIQQYLELRKLPNMLENILTSGKRAADIVKNMLSFARKSENFVSSHDLGSLLDQTLEMLKIDYDMKKYYDFKQIEIVRQYDDKAGLIPCEGSKLQQVFMNLLKNGAEAMAEVKNAPAPPAFVLRIKGDGDWVRVEIEDNGPGMDETTRRRIFEPFFTTKPMGKGTGLGLSVSYFIITEVHGGEMSAHASEGEGTRFVIRLPKTGKS